MCPQPSCPNQPFHQAQAKAIVMNVHQIDELHHERDYWHTMFDRLAESFGQDPATIVLTLASRADA